MIFGLSLSNIGKQSPYWANIVSRTGLALVGAIAAARLAGYDVAALLTVRQQQILAACVTGFYFIKILMDKNANPQ